VVYGFFVGSMGHAAFSVLLPVIMTRWFTRHMGLALGLYWAGQGIGPVIFAPLFRWLLDTRGWHHTFTIIGVVIGIILFVFSLFIHNSPAVKGLKPYGAVDEDDPPAKDRPRAAAAKAAVAQISVRDILRQRVIWQLMAIHHIGCVAHAVILAHVVSMATFKGVPGVQAASVLATIAGVSVISRFVFSILAERLGGRLVLTISLLGQALPVIILYFASEAWVFYLFAVIFGLCYGGEMVGFPIINKQLFGANAPLSTVYSFEMLGASTGMALGGWLGGALFDASGSYAWSLTTSLVVGLIGLPLALSLPRHKKQPV
jgi:MFS family permease